MLIVSGDRLWRSILFAHLRIADSAWLRARYGRCRAHQHVCRSNGQLPVVVVRQNLNQISNFCPATKPAAKLLKYWLRQIPEAQPESINCSPREQSMRRRQEASEEMLNPASGEILSPGAIDRRISLKSWCRSSCLQSVGCN